MISIRSNFERPVTAAMLNEEDVRFLGEIGLMAVGANNADGAHAIFSGLLVLRPDRVLPYIGLALACQIKGRFDEAIRILSEDGMRRNPNSDEIRVFLGIVLENAGRPGAGRRTMRELVATAECDSAARRMAQSFLAAVECTPQRVAGFEECINPCWATEKVPNAAPA